MKTVEELLQENGGQMIKAVRTYRNTREWNQFAEDFKELYESAKRVS